MVLFSGTKRFMSFLYLVEKTTSLLSLIWKRTGFEITGPVVFSSKTDSGLVWSCFIITHPKTQWLKTIIILLHLVVLWADWAQTGGSSAPHGVDWYWNNLRALLGSRNQDGSLRWQAVIAGFCMWAHCISEASQSFSMWSLSYLWFLTCCLSFRSRK